MKILMVNKFLYPNGGSETYIFKLGEYLTSVGHEVQYFGMEDERNIVGNNVGSYTSNMDFHGGSISKCIYPFKTIYSFEARKKIRKVLDDFKPDVVHLNNINFQLTPSVIYEVKKKRIPLFQTVHDPQVVCPNHRLYIEKKEIVCDKCISGRYMNCMKNKCLDNSIMKSFIAMVESYIYHTLKTYNKIDKYICPSKFMAGKLIEGGINSSQIDVMHNFSDKVVTTCQHKAGEKYALYFGRISIEKGIKTLIQVCKELPEIKFIFAGSGPLSDSLHGIKNIEYVGFKKGKELRDLIEEAVFTVYPSEWYDNCPLSIIESQAYGTPVIGADIGGIPELIIHNHTGLIFESGNKLELKKAIKRLYTDDDLEKQMIKECLSQKNNSIDIYADKLICKYQRMMEAKA
ncbi:glycosyltransferase [Clostridium psychrophilum]|uniref:glycosyltransferase n=1 Tax=Clostridium psychrophilum TaxID=132926 RepID=UPI001C0B96F7|nr:glycosyltransferase [Clostridium psychrophilum]MBU3179840.1 glycosyltransferase [Clostridium psychrophilum]